MQRSEISSQGPTIAEIDLSAFKENVKTLKLTAKKSMLLAVIKTNAYGHGVVPIGLAAVEAGAERLGVTTVKEGALLRENDISVPVHLLSAVMPEQADEIAAKNLTASVSSKELAVALSRAAVKKGNSISVHLKIDTGLHRFGIEPDEAIAFCQSCYHLPNLHWEGIYTHFSSADEADWETTEKQYKLFMRTVSKLADQGFFFPIYHVGGSTITIERSDMHLDIVRPGIALFGYQPDARQEKIISVKPVMKLKSKILHIKELPPKTPVGYGGEYVTETTKKIAVVPIGHGDGYQRALSNKGEMLVGGKRAKIIGTISLDQTLIDITNIPNVKVGDEVVLLGSQGDEMISARDIAGWMDSIVDEVLAGLMERVRRVYV
ncbi:alanine racemase [Virgibacillus indicus]|uniref:alanine racemase n=1 Tax=Virgibacillus indicus TaxID=2024554 RepID=UPI001F0A124E|nr:alanine racemase [Virgibacillus indicus]